jgi:hypothetical protein
MHPLFLSFQLGIYVDTWKYFKAFNIMLLYSGIIYQLCRRMIFSLYLLSVLVTGP